SMLLMSRQKRYVRSPFRSYDVRCFFQFSAPQQSRNALLLPAKYSTDAVETQEIFALSSLSDSLPVGAFLLAVSATVFSSHSQPKVLPLHKNMSSTSSAVSPYKFLICSIMYITKYYCAV